MKKLNLGCGYKIRSDCVNVDIAPLSGVDIVADLNKHPYPFENEAYDTIFCEDVLEHLSDFEGCMRELHRVLKKGGKLFISVPHFSSADNFIDPSHKKMFSASTFGYFVKNHPRNYYYDFHFMKLESKIVFRKKNVFFLGHILEPLVNLSNHTRLFFEVSGLHNLFPAWNIHITLEK